MGAERRVVREGAVQIGERNETMETSDEMDWLNIHRSTLAAEQFLGCDPVQRATWLCLLAYCADQENGGRIEAADTWGDRKWQQVVRVTRDEVHDSCPLWSWENGALVVWAYPIEKEAEVRRNRENGKTGGRPPKPNGNQVVSSGLTQTEPSAPISAETERKGKEGNMKGNNSAVAEEIYQAYPRKIARAPGIKAIERALRSIDPASLLQAVQVFARSCIGKDPQYIPYPASWFNAGRWSDEAFQAKVPQGAIQFETLDLSKIDPADLARL